MTTILFMDDDTIRCNLFLERHPEAQIVHTAQECIQQLQKQSWDYVCLDHDLGEDTNNTGSFVAEWIAMNKPRIGKVIIHSWNIVAADRMSWTINTAGYQCVMRSFGKGFLDYMMV